MGHGFNMRVLQLKHTRRSRRKSTPTFMLKLVVHVFIKRYPCLHATPDFLCYCTLCDCCAEGCREVKCPYCLKDTVLKDYPDNCNSCLKSGKGTTSLKREHAYYYQSQQQIFTTGYHYLCFYWTNCFVLWKNSPSQPDRQTDRQTDSLYFSTMIIKAMQLVGSCINTKPKSKIYA